MLRLDVADDSEPFAVGLDGGVARGGLILDELVEGGDAVSPVPRLYALGEVIEVLGDEQEPELVAGGQAAGGQAPVRPDLELEFLRADLEDGREGVDRPRAVAVACTAACERTGISVVTRMARARPESRMRPAR